MTIKTIEIKNFKSIKYIKLNISEINAFVGKNGTGKTTIFKAIEYFYKNLIDINPSDKHFDLENPYSDQLDISIEYDLSRISNFATGSYAFKLSNMMRTRDFFSNNTYTVRLSQKRNEQIKWNVDYNERYIIFNSHPVYFCDARNISLTNWREIWNVVGDLVNAKDANEIIEELYSSLKNDSSEAFNKYSKIFESFLDKNDLSVTPYSKKSKIIKLLQVQLGGEVFISNNETLEYYSDGTNSQNYILFLMYIAFEVSRKRLKDVTIFLDEPELGLHPKMIDELMNKLVDYSKHVKFIIFSHSSRLVAFVLRNNGELYNIFLKNFYTHIKRIDKAIDDKYKLIVTEREASYLFSDFLLFVEGVTEVEIFNHQVLNNLFPILKRIDIINTNSNDHILKMMLPKRNKISIPYLVLIDLDKLIDFNITSSTQCKFTISNLWYSPLVDKDLHQKLKYNFAKKSSKHYLYALNNIQHMIKSSFSYSEKFHLIDNFEKTYSDIKQFCLLDDVYPVRTTIEGSLINKNSNKYFNRWRKNRNPNARLSDNSLNLEEKVVLNRLICSGKTDILTDYKSQTSRPNFNRIDIESIKKNSEWISEFLNFYDENVLQQKQFASDYDNSKKKARFAKDFPELYDILNNINKRISDE